MTTCKNNDKPRVYPWSVYVSPSESHTEFGIITECSQIYTVPKVDVIEYAYNLSPDTMRKVDQALQFGIGVVNVDGSKNCAHLTNSLEKGTVLSICALKALPRAYASTKLQTMRL